MVLRRLNRLPSLPLSGHVLALAVFTIASVAGAQSRNPAPAPAITVTESLPTLLQRGAQAFAAGEYAVAAAAFAQVERDFGTEAEWREGRLPQRLLPLRGFAELRAGLAADAAESLGAFLERFPDDASQRSFVLYALALALRQSGQLDAARARFEAYEQENAGTAQAALAGLQRAEIFFEQDQPDAALALLEELAREGATESLRGQARLRALQKAVELHRDAIAARLLLGPEAAGWSFTTMPEIGVLAFAAMELGDRLMAAGHSDDALRAYRYVLPKDRLVTAQRVRLAELQARFDERAPTIAAGSGSFWIDFYRTRLARVEAQLRGIEAAEDHTAPLRLRTGQAYLLAGRHREAWLVFEHLALRSDISAELRREAHYRWILAAVGFEAWEDALTIARGFVDRYPDADDLPETFYLIARAHLEQGRFAEAEEVFGDILFRFPQHAAAERARFTRGWVRAMRENHAAARDDLDRYLADHPQGPLATNAALWRALTFFFERKHAEALAAFDELAQTMPPAHPLLPEVLYRRGTTLYAMRDFARARGEMEQFVRRFGEHPRAPEALVLLGDILMGAGELATARERFAQIPPEATSSFVYGVFQTGKILRAEEDYAGMVDHFTAYTTRTDLPAQPRISEALYWIGWAEQQRGHPEAARPIFESVLARFGNDPHAGEVSATLTALEGFDRRSGGAADFDPWIEQERTRARAAQHFTYYARLGVFLADRHAKRKQPHQEEATLLDIAGVVPIEALDAGGLARVGLVLQDIGSPDGARHFERLLQEFPASFERGAAFYGLAAEALKAHALADATNWLERFARETPTHPLAPKAALLAGRALEEAGRFDEAIAHLENLLRLKSARGRPHAEALLGMARCHQAAGRTEKAIGCYQRVYTVYRAYGDLVAAAYLRSATLFENLGNLEAAAATHREMLASARIGSALEREAASEALQRLTPLLPAKPESEAALAP